MVALEKIQGPTQMVEDGHHLTKRPLTTHPHHKDKMVMIVLSLKWEFLHTKDSLCIETTQV